MALNRGSVVTIMDSSDGKFGRIIGGYGGKQDGFKPGDIVKISIFDVVPNGKILKGTLSKAIIWSCRQTYKNNQLGIIRKMSKNSVALIKHNDKNQIILAAKVKGLVDSNVLDIIIADAQKHQKKADIGETRRY